MVWERRIPRWRILLAAVAIGLAPAVLLLSDGGMAAPKLHEVKGVLHIHSIHSDGSGTVDQIAAAANRSGLDFLLLTDHDNLKALEDGGEGWRGSTLLLVGSEVATRDGHVVVGQVPPEFNMRGRSGQEVLDAVAGAGGIGFLAHPYSQHALWKDWSASGFAGIELINLMKMLEDDREKIKQTAFSMVLSGGLNYRTLFGQGIAKYPRAEIEKWDELCARRRVVAVGGADAHARYPFNGQVLHLPPYKETFDVLRTHLLLSEPYNKDLAHDRKLTYDALAAGHAFLGFDLLGDTTGFRFVAHGPHAVASMGDVIPFARDLRLEASVPVPKEMTPEMLTIRLLRHGLEVASARGSSLSYQPDRPGSYRVEVCLPGKENARQLWILSNPIYLERASMPP